MAEKSHFPRVVLVKSLSDDCVPALRDCVGKYTHIQSFNGNLLDGLSISDVTSIIQSSLNMSSIQLMVRYVHPVSSKTYSTGLTGGAEVMKTPISPIPEKQPANRISTQETLPIPLMILGDIHVRCKELFNYLSGSEMVKVLNSDEEESSQVSARSGSNVGGGGGGGEGTTLVSATNSLLVPSRSMSHPARSETSFSSYDSRESSDVVGGAGGGASGGGGGSFPLFQSDKYVRRLSISHSLFTSSNVSSPSTTPIRTAATANQPHPSYFRQHTQVTVEKRYILNMFTQEMDRKFVHLYLRQSGVYLVVVSVEDLVEDPVIQFENLSFWLRLVQTYVGPSGIKRVMVVGMSDGHMDGEREKECLANLEGAIREAEFQHMFVRGSMSVIPFDRSRPRASLEHLCKCIGKCMEALTSRAWHMHRNFYENVFQPFSGLTEVLHSLSRSREMLMSADSILSLYKFADSNFFDTLAAYSSGLIDDRCEWCV